MRRVVLVAVYMLEERGPCQEAQAFLQACGKDAQDSRVCARVCVCVCVCVHVCVDMTQEEHKLGGRLGAFTLQAS